MAEEYVASVTVSVTLKAQEGGVVAEYSVTRDVLGTATPQGSGELVEQALVRANAAEKSLRAGMVNSEARRLK